MFPALTRLFRMKVFDVRSKYYVSELLSNGWICSQDEDLWEEIRYSSRFLDLHASQEADSRAAFQSSGSCSNSASYAKCSARMVSNSMILLEKEMRDLLQRTECKESARVLLLVPLKTEFYRKPRSLLQLSRLQILRSVGSGDFERRVKSLPLPPLLLADVRVGVRTNCSPIYSL